MTIVAAEIELYELTPASRQVVDRLAQIIQTAKFTSDAASWNAVQWRLVVVPVLKTSDLPLRFLARVFWLAPDAPHELLIPGEEFELMRTMTSPMARGRILSGPLVPKDSDVPDPGLF